jgi:hypothetical protein
MIICFKFGNQLHCYDIPIIEIPVGRFHPGPGPVNYPAFLHDATVIGSLHAAANKVSDGTVREALLGGIDAAARALKKRGGDHISNVSFEGTAGGPPTGGGAHGPGHKE